MDHGRRGVGRQPRVPGRKVFFSQDKKHETFGRLSRTHPAAHAKWPKFFGSFFQKRTLSSSPCRTRHLVLRLAPGRFALRDKFMMTAFCVFSVRFLL
jgi:hypothetical protein